MPGLGQSEVVGVGEPSGGPQFHPGSLTLFKVEAGEGSDGGRSGVQRRGLHHGSGPRVRLRKLSLLEGREGPMGVYCPGISQLRAYNTGQRGN